jgi:GNAT superfamily N-acetyltransferase
MTSEFATTVSIRRTHLDELDWVNARYAEVDFLPSVAGDLIVVAHVNGIAAGLGRIVPQNDQVGELGGMVVFDAFQGQGLAKRMITALHTLSQFHILYCLPFAELEKLYVAMGFIAVTEPAAVPAAVVEKHRWCNAHYAKPVSLLRWGRASMEADAPHDGTLA